LHYYQFNIGDYAKRTRHLSNIEDLAYRRLIDLYYTNESPMPDDIKQIARLITMRENLEEIGNVLSDFFVLDNGFWHNKRADEEITNYHAKSVTARANGKKGGRPKKPNPNPEITQRVNLANPEITGSEANQEPLTNNHKTVTNKQEPLTSNQEPKKIVVAWLPPQGLNMEAWAEFEEHRKSTKGKFSDLARTKAANSIINLSQEEQQATIDRSIQAGWSGLFPEKSTQQDTRPFFQKNNDSVREQLFGKKKGETYEH
jgi:uncharacterized protein YdaU (DUF1376 family)